MIKLSLANIYIGKNMYYKGERHAKTYFLLFLQENITI